MGQITNFFQKVMNKAVYHYSYEAKEIRKIRRVPRYRPGNTKILGSDFTFSDSASFIGQYFTIVNDQMYNFETASETPYIIDCGANVGVSIVYFKKKYPNSEIVAFEPDKNVFAILEKNIQSRGYDNVTLINKGVWNHEGKIQFLTDGADGGSILTDAKEFVDKQPVAEIETTSLKPYLNRKVDFLKIDIEGAEAIVIEDCQNLLQNVQFIFIEHHGSASEMQRLDFILSILAKNGFRYYIESAVIANRSPFINRYTIKNFDNFLNIYAYK